MWMLKNLITLFIDITPNISDMKRVILASILVLGTMLSEAQSWNPYVSQGIISPLLPEEFREPGVASFNLGNSGSSPLLFDRNNSDNNLSVIITMSDGLPDKRNPLSALKGQGVSYFDWSYDRSTNTFTGVQKRDIPGYFQTSLTVGFQANNNSPLDVASNGFQIKLKTPAYLGGSNTTQDDVVSSYTATRAFDYGDAPESYGRARHEINLNKDPLSGDYNRYIVLGSIVDHDPFPNFSDPANGDNIYGEDDEDGVIFPVLSVGNSYVVPVTVTVHGESFGVLNAWFDWNGDGDFLDPGEKVNGAPIPVYSSGIIPLQVSVPEDAVFNQHIYARFRIGGNTGPVGDNMWGEVEDYRIFIHSAELSATALVTQPSGYGELDGAIELLVTGGKLPYTFEWSNGASSEDLSGLGPGNYEVVVTDAANNKVTASVIITWPDRIENGRTVVDIPGIDISVYPNPVTDKYYVNISRDGKYRLELVNAAGSLVYNEIVVFDAGNGNMVQLSREDLVSGAYVMRITGVDSEVFRTVKITMMQQK